VLQGVDLLGEMKVSFIKCVAVFYSVLQYVALCCNTLHNVVVGGVVGRNVGVLHTLCCSVLQCAADCCRVLQWWISLEDMQVFCRECVVFVAVCCRVLQCVAVCCSVMQCTLQSVFVVQCVAAYCRMCCSVFTVLH